MLVLFILVPTLAQQLTKPIGSSRSQIAFQAPLLASKYRPAQRLPLQVAHGFMPKYAPEYAPNRLGDPETLETQKSMGSSYGGSSGGFRPRGGSGTYVRPSSEATYDTAGLTPDQKAFLARQRGEAGFGGGLDTHGRPAPGGAPAPAASAPASGEFAGMTPDQIDFIKRKRGEIQDTGGLDTHGRPRQGGGAPAPSPAYASAAAPSGGGSGEFAGMTPDQVEFIRRKRGEIGMTGGLDTHGRPRYTKEAPSVSVLGIATTALLGFSTGVVGFFGILRLRRNLFTTFKSPLLTQVA